MAEARAKHDWSQTSSVLALIANAHRDPKKSPGARPFKPSDFDPTTGRHSATDEGPKPTVGIEVLKQVFLKGKG